MKIILSRKGFDSSVGGYPSPVLPDGRLVSLPIPSSLDTLSYQDIRLSDELSYQDLLRDLSAGGKLQGRGAHLDPDLISCVRPRKPGWKPSLGQIGAAAGHLHNQGVGEGDLFFFFGWFRHTRWLDGRLGYVGEPMGFHCIYGYMRIGKILDAPPATRLPVWLQSHPHGLSARMQLPNNRLYIAAGKGEKLEEVKLEKTEQRCEKKNYEAGVFRYSDTLRLSKPGFSRSRWYLDPAIFKHLRISYHNAQSWKADYFQSYPRAQEYVIHGDENAQRWATELISQAIQWR